LIGQARAAADTAGAFASKTTEYADRLFGAASITMPSSQRWRHIGGFARSTVVSPGHDL
jgi:hypothetical protein